MENQLYVIEIEKCITGNMSADNYTYRIKNNSFIDIEVLEVTQDDEFYHEVATVTKNKVTNKAGYMINTKYKRHFNYVTITRKT